MKGVGLLIAGLVAGGLSLGALGGCRSASVSSPRGLAERSAGAGGGARIYIPGGEQRLYRVVGTEDRELRGATELDEAGRWAVVVHERDRVPGGPIRVIGLAQRADGAVEMSEITQSDGQLTDFEPPIVVMPAGGIGALAVGTPFESGAAVTVGSSDGSVRRGEATHETELIGFDDQGRAVVRQRLFMDLGAVTVERALLITADSAGIAREEQARTVKFTAFVVDRESRTLERIEE